MILPSDLLPLSKVLKPQTVSLLASVDIGPLYALVSKLPESYWRRQNEVKENEYSVFHSTDHIVMRFVEPNDDPREFKAHLSWKLCESVVMPIMAEISNVLGIANPVYPKAMFARLNAHSEIDLHIDHGSSHALVHKIHVPLISHAEIQFKINDEVFFLQPKHAYEVNNLKPHGVSNPTDIDRVHFIFEVFEGQPNSHSVDMSEAGYD